MDAISVIIPVYNDPNGIDTTLRTLVQQSYQRYEILPVDNDSTDTTPDVIRTWARQAPDLVRPCVEREVQSSYAARNTGIRRAQGEILVFIDADMTVSSDWLSAIADAFSMSGAHYLGYEIEVSPREGENSIWGWYDTVTGLPSRYYYEEQQFVPTAGLAVKNVVFEKVGLFVEDLTSGGDKEFGNRVFNHPELRTHFADDVTAFHPARTTFREHWQKTRRIGRGLAQLSRTESNETSGALLRDIALHALPPDPLRVCRRARHVEPHQFPLLYLLDLLIRYLRLYAALAYLLEPSEPAEEMGSPPAEP